VTVTIAHGAYADTIRHLTACIPNEGVGLLAGPAVFPGTPCPADTDGDGDCGRRHCPTCGIIAGRMTIPRDIGGRAVNRLSMHLDHWTPLVNTAEHPRVRYEVEHTELLFAHEALEDDGRYPWVVVHSHVTASTSPSPVDVEYARNPRQLHLIVSLAGLHPAATLWRLDPHGAQRPEKIRFQVVDLGGQENPPTDLTHGVTGA